MSQIVNIPNKYAKNCVECEADVGEFQGFAVLDKTLPKAEQKWLTYCTDCYNRFFNKDKPAPAPEQEEDEDLPF